MVLFVWNLQFDRGDGHESMALLALRMFSKIYLNERPTFQNQKNSNRNLDFQLPFEK